MSAARRALLEELIAGTAPSALIVERLATFGWDSEEELVVMKRIDAANLVRRFVAGELDAVRVAEWADAIEGRDDIGFEPAAASLLDELVFELANPEITQALSVDRAHSWIRRLEDSAPGV